MEEFAGELLRKLYKYQEKTGRDTFYLSESCPCEKEIWGMKIAPSLDPEKKEYSLLDSCVFWGHITYRRVGRDFEITIRNNPHAWGARPFKSKK